MHEKRKGKLCCVAPAADERRERTESDLILSLSVSSLWKIGYLFSGSRGGGGTPFFVMALLFLSGISGQRVCLTAVAAAVFRSFRVGQESEL